jgi:prephenate dehydratase/chorismate mutase
LPNAKSAPSGAIRGKIDEIDGQIVELLARRLGLAREIGSLKAAAAKRDGKRRPSVLVPEREEEIFRRLRGLAEAGKLPWPLVQAVFTEVISLCRAAQGKVEAHVLGPAGTHSEWAARSRFGEALELSLHDSIPRAIKAAEQAVASGNPNAVAIVPIENNQEGTVNATVDALLGTSLKLIGEGFYRVRHALLSRASDVRDVKTVFSHPMGFAQCGRWLHENLPHAKHVEVASTAEAARHAAGHGASRMAAIASPYLAGADGLNAIANDIQDSMENTTRFGVLGAALPGPSGDDKTSLVFSLPNKSGALSEALTVFSRSKLNMTKIESRPHKGLQWEYLFYVDIDGHSDQPRVSRALKAFGEKVRYFKILGAYPKGRAWN